MTPEKFLQNLLESQNLSPQQERDLESHKNEITNFLRAEFGQDPIIKYAGSYAKGTMISDCYDLDIVSYFPSSDARSLKDIRDDVATHLGKEYLTKPKASAERILDLKNASAPKDFHIDVVPGRFIEDSDDVFLHVAYGEKERMQTNLKTHINYIKNSGCVPVIRLVKLWAYRNNIQIKTFVLELFVIDALSGSRNKDNLKNSFIKVMEQFRDRFETVQLTDPANTNNVVSRAVESLEKKAVALEADNVIEELENPDDLTAWRLIFKESNNQSFPSQTFPSSPNSSGGFTPESPWTEYA